MKHRTVVIGRTLISAWLFARHRNDVVKIASQGTINRVRGVAADELIVTFPLTPSAARRIAAVANPCVATLECSHLSRTGGEGPIRDLGRWPVVWVCDGCGHIEVDPSLPDSGASS